jgi:hypothetical protein
MNAGCPEKIDAEFVRWIWRYRRDSLPKVLETIEPLRAIKTVHHFRSRREADRWLEAQPPVA